MAFNKEQKNNFNSCLELAFSGIENKKWGAAIQQFNKANELLVNHWPELTFSWHNLKGLLYLFKFACRYQNNPNKELILASFFNEIGVILYLNSPPIIPKLWKTKLVALQNQNGWISLDMKKLEKSFNNLVAAGTLFKQATDLWMGTYQDTNKNPLINVLNHTKIRFPTYLEFMIAAADSYQRLSTTAISKSNKHPHEKSKRKNAPSLKDFEWELLLTAEESSGYTKNSYYAKAYICRKRKIVLIAHKGSDNYEDVRADYEIFKHRIPTNYFNKANQFLAAVTDILKKEEKELFDKYDFFMTGHSLGGAIAELLACQHHIPTLTFDSPGVKDIIEQARNNFQESDLKQVPVTCIMSAMNLVNTCNGHAGRVLKIPQDYYVKSAFIQGLTKLGTEQILQEFLYSTLGAGMNLTTKGILQIFVTADTYDMISSDIKKQYLDLMNTLNTHILDIFFDYMANQHPKNFPNSFKVVTAWPNGIQDGNTIPIEKPYRERIIPLSYFPPDMQLAIHRFAKQELGEFPNGYETLERMLAGISITDNNGGKLSEKNHLLIKGLFTADEFRLHLWHYFKNPRHKALQQFFRVDNQHPQNIEQNDTLNGGLTFVNDYAKTLYKKTSAFFRSDTTVSIAATFLGMLLTAVALRTDDRRTRALSLAVLLVVCVALAKRDNRNERTESKEKKQETGSDLSFKR